MTLVLNIGARWFQISKRAGTRTNPRTVGDAGRADGMMRRKKAIRWEVKHSVISLGAGVGRCAAPCKQK